MRFAVICLVFVVTIVSCMAEVCETEGCLEVAHHILSTYDPSVDLCEDFFHFACGKWLNTTEIPSDTGEFGVFNQVNLVVEERILDLLESENPKSANHGVLQLVRMFYRKCLAAADSRTAKDDYLLYRKLNSLIEESAQSDEALDLTTLLADISTDFSLDPLFKLDVGVDEHNKSIHVLYLGEVELILGSRDYYLSPEHENRIIAYKRFVSDTIALLEKSDENSVIVAKGNITTRVDDIVDFERHLADLRTPTEDTRNATRQYNKLTIAELNSLMPQVNWNAYLEKVLPGEIDLYKTWTLVAASPSYLSRLGDLISTTEKQTVLNYCWWFVAWNYVKLLDSRYTSTYQLLAEVTEGVKKEPTRRTACVKTTENYFYAAIGALYVERHFSVSSHNEINVIVKNMAAEIVKVIERLDWMNSNTKTSAKDKVLNIVSHLGFPGHMINAASLLHYHKELDIDNETSFLETTISMSEWRRKMTFANLLKPFEREKYDFNAAVIDAYYDLNMNSLIIPAGILQPPFFKDSYPPFINYGAIGYVVGHELTHVFDDEGKLHNWWSDDSGAQFKQKVKCFVNQYNNYYVAEANVTINGEMTQGENIADAGGVDLAWKTYKLHSNPANPEVPPLPRINLTADQLFFLSTASFHCKKYTREAMIGHLAENAHTIEEFRVMGYLSNLKQFAKAFKCAANTTYNPDRKCLLM